MTWNGSKLECHKKVRATAHTIGVLIRVGVGVGVGVRVRVVMHASGGFTRLRICIEKPLTR